MNPISNSPANSAARAIAPSKADSSATKTDKASIFDFHSLSEQKHKIKELVLNPKQKFYKKTLKIFNNEISKTIDSLSPLAGLVLASIAASTGVGMLASVLYGIAPILISKLNTKALVPWLNRKNEELNDNDPKVNLNRDLVFDKATQENLFYKIKQFLGYKSELQTEELGKTVGTSNGNLLILHGPPGTGKTAIAEGVAAIAKKPLIKVNVNEIESKYVGESEKEIAAKFKLAKKMGAYLFFDEADALLMPRPENNATGGSIHQTKITNTFIQNFNEHSDKVKVILATNTANSLDNAIKSRSILCSVPAPNIEMQLKILYKKLSDFGLSKERTNLIKSQETELRELLSKDFAHFTGRDIESAVKAAFFIAESRAQQSASAIDFKLADIEQAFTNLNSDKERSNSSELRPASQKEQIQKSKAFLSLLGV
ncbi:MAG: ATP-binding protein [Candidatus Melainabacteria bacterium]|nr:ATP-binding protein [Candidatus Melainabacteria bacterium]